MGSNGCSHISVGPGEQPRLHHHLASKAVLFQSDDQGQEFPKHRGFFNRGLKNLFPYTHVSWNGTAALLTRLTKVLALTVFLMAKPASAPKTSSKFSLHRLQWLLGSFLVRRLQVYQRYLGIEWLVRKLVGDRHILNVNVMRSWSWRSNASL